MKLQRLQLSNFRQYTDLDITFDDGITAIVGANGSGKSTLLEAICWSLYGAEALRSKVEEVRPLFLNLLDSSSQRARGTSPKAVLTFTLGDKVYEVERAAQGARLYRVESEREAVADGTTAVNSAVQRLLGGMTYRQFLTSFFAQQGELEFLHFDKARRREEVLRMLGLERVTRSAKWMEEQLYLQRSELRGKQSLPISEEEAKANLEQAKEELAAARADLQNSETSLQAAKAEWERYLPIKQEWTAKKAAYDSLQMQLQLLEGNIQLHQQEITRLQSDLNEAQAARERLEEMRPQGERYKAVREQLRNTEDLQRHEQRRAELRVQIESLKAQSAERELQLADAEAELVRLHSQKLVLDQEAERVRTLSEAARQAEELRRRLEELDRKKNDVQKQVTTVEAQIASLNERIEQLNRQAQAIEGVSSDAERTATLTREAEGRVRELEAELARLERLRASAIAAADTEARNLRQQMRELEERRQNVEQLGPDGECPVCTRRLGGEFASVMKHFDAELETAERRLQAVLSRKAEAERDTESIEQCTASLQEARADLERYREQFTRLQEQLRQREEWLEECQRLRARTESLVEQREKTLAIYDAHEHETVRQQLSEYQPLEQQAVVEQQVLQERLSQWHRETARAQDMVEQLRQALQGARKSIHSAEDELSRLPAGYDADLHEQLRRELQVLQEVWDEALRLRPIAERYGDLQARYQQTQQLLRQEREHSTDTRQKLQELAYDAEEYERVLEQFSNAEDNLREAEAQVRVLQERVQYREANYATLEEQWVRLQEYLREVRELRRAIQRDETVRGWLRSFGDLLNGEVVPELQERAGELLNLLTDGRYTQVQISEDFEFTLVDEDRPKPIVSGGEEDIVNLSLRLAMAEMICERTGQPLGLLVLDEVFGSLDADRRENTLQLLRRLRDRFDQIIIISHIEEIQAGADQCLRVDYNPSEHRSVVREYNLYSVADSHEADDPMLAQTDAQADSLGGLFGP